MDDSKVFEIIKKNVRKLYREEKDYSEQILKNYNDDGSFDDLDYTNQNWTSWHPFIHIKRASELCIMFATKENKQYHNSELEEKIIKLIRFYINGKFVCDNWWMNDVGVPSRCGEILLTFGDRLDEEDREEVIRIFKGNPKIPRVFVFNDEGTEKNMRPYKSQSSHVISAFVDTLIYLVACDKSPSVAMQHIKDCIKALNYEFYFVPWASGKSPDGAYGQEHSIKSDYSYHEHENAFVQNSYGRITDHLEKVFMFIEGTDINCDEECYKEMINYLVDSQEYTWYKGYSPMMAMGRDVAYQERPSYYRKETVDSLIGVCDALSKKTNYRKEELILMRDRLLYPEKVERNEATKYFWHSDFISHNRKNYQFSVHGVSTRIKRPESILKKNLKGMFLGDGCYNVLLDGNEYDNINMCLDWRKLPGVTANQNVTDEQLNPECEIDTTIDTLRIFGGAKGTEDYAGGISDGKYGFFAMNYNHLGVKAKKSWFCFDEGVVCLGAGIKTEKGASAFTTIEQSRLKENASLDGNILERGERSARGKRIINGNVGYLLLDESEIYIKNDAFTGRFCDIDKDSGTTELQERDIFLAGINHGENVENGSYAYEIIPFADDKMLKEFESNNNIVIVENSENIQAVWNKKDRILQAAFYDAGEINFDGIIIKSDTDCALMLTLNEDNSYVLWVSDPRHTEKTVEITLDGKIENKIDFFLQKGYRYNNLGRPLAYHSVRKFLPYEGARDDK